MHEATLRLESGGPYGEPTEHTDTTVELWCNDHSDLLSIRGDADAVLAAVETGVGIRDRIERDDRTLVVTAGCLQEQEGTVERYLRRHGCLLLPPLTYAAGAKICRVLALDPADLTDLYRDLVDGGSVTVESKHAVDEPPAENPGSALDAAIPTLSPRQRETLVVAHDRGYYERPRETTTAAIAAELDVGRRTAEEHLRRAERKVMDALVADLSR